MTTSLPGFTRNTEIRDDRTGLHLRVHTGFAPVEDILVAKLILKDDPEENAANALLFKAAPDLYDALKDIVESTADIDEDHRTQARIALRASLGE